MATASEATGSTAVVYTPVGKGNLAVAYNTITVATTDLDAADTIDLVRLPKGALVHDIVLTATDMDTNGSPALVIDVGDSGDTDRFINAATVGQTASTVRAGNDATAAATLAAHTAYTAETLIYATVVTAAATAAAGTIKVAVFYSVA